MGHTSLFERYTTSRLFINALPELDIRYFSNLIAGAFSLKAQYHTISQGRNLDVLFTLPSLSTIIRFFRSDVYPVYVFYYLFYFSRYKYNTW